ncbi:MAG: hypothetical protein AMXMBFR4_11190 [Candidatus Hydrogenedentota bacterium]
MLTPLRLLSFLVLCPLLLYGQPEERAKINASRAQEAFARSKRVMDAWMARRDPVTGLLPRRGGENTWYVRDSAADLYPFLVMAAYYTDRHAYRTAMHEILRAEIQWSSRVGALPDNVLPGGGFERQEMDFDQIVFGSCEYVKDGLLPLTELLGHHGWRARMVSIVDELSARAPYETAFGRVPSASAEVNGEFLQALARLAFYTRDPRYVEQALAITRFYFEEVIPKSNGLPAHVWDFKEGRPASDRFVLADHGNEIVAGLSEFVLYLKETHHPAFADFKSPLADLVHLLLDVGLNEDGVWYSSISTTDHKPVDARHAHCWGYLFNGVYTAYLITGEERFQEVTRNALKTVVEKPSYLDDPEGSGRKYGSNAYSDAIESAVVFLNRFPDESMFRVLDECVARFLARQRDDGIIEDWYGDGNYVRTALMYALMKQQGCWVEPWRADLRLGAARTDDGVLLSIESDEEWKGRIRFDIPRHREFFQLPVNYPRLNEWPEWFVVEQDRLYKVTRGDQSVTRTGAELVQGLEIVLSPGSALSIVVAPIDGPPYEH